jgi:hypothetical protein
MMSQSNEVIDSTFDNSQILQVDKESLVLLPRTAWTNKVRYLKHILKTKLALDKVEKLLQPTEDISPDAMKNR